MTLIRGITTIGIQSLLSSFRTCLYISYLTNRVVISIRDEKLVNYFSATISSYLNITQYYYIWINNDSKQLDFIRKLLDEESKSSPSFNIYFNSNITQIFQFFVLPFGSKTFLTPVNIHSSILSMLIVLSCWGREWELDREICWGTSSKTNMPWTWNMLVTCQVLSE